MILNENQIREKYGKICGHCGRNRLLLQCEYEFTCFICGNNVVNWKNELSKTSRKRWILITD